MIDYGEKQDMDCDECGATFEVQHEMGLQYIAQYCSFCGEEIIQKEERIDYEDERLLNWHHLYTFVIIPKFKNMRY